MSKPLIGIVEWPYKDKDDDIIYEVFPQIVEWITKCGGRPIGIFPTQKEDYTEKRVSEIRQMTECEQVDLKESINICDAIIKPGAIKIYNHERFIYRHTLEKNMPYLGICAGMQIMANNEKENIWNDKNEDGSHKGTVHDINILETTKLFNIIKENKILVNSRHNFHVPEDTVLKSQNIISAYAEDGIIEAIENPNCDFHMGLQWHPELMENSEYSEVIFEAFIESAKKYSKSK